MGGPLPKENDRLRQDCSCQLHEDEATQGRQDGERGDCLHSGRERASSALGGGCEGLFWVHDPPYASSADEVSGYADMVDVH